MAIKDILWDDLIENYINKPVHDTDISLVLMALKDINSRVVDVEHLCYKICEKLKIETE